MINKKIDWLYSEGLVLVLYDMTSWTTRTKYRPRLSLTVYRRLICIYI